MKSALTHRGRRPRSAGVWDYFEVTGDNYIDLREVLLVLEHFGHGPTGDAMDNLLDRRSSDPTKPWRSAEANDGIDLTDALTALAGHGTAAAFRR